MNGVSAGVVETDALKHFPNREEMLEHSTRADAGRPPRRAGRRRGRRRVPLLAGAKMVCGQTLIVDGGFSLLA